ncbi:reverse transcriptase domain-containing protein, partial [Tanacetum coccineum]
KSPNPRGDLRSPLGTGMGMKNDSPTGMGTGMRMGMVNTIPEIPRPIAIPTHDNTVLHDNNALYNNTVPHDNTVLHDNNALHNNTIPHDNTVLHDNNVLHDNCPCNANISIMITCIQLLHFKPMNFT